MIFGITYAVAAAFQPGPFQTYIISQTLKNGWRATISSAFAPIISDIPVFILIIFLLNSVSGSFINILRIMGGLFLLYLGYRAFNSWRKYDETNHTSNTSPHKTFFNAVLVNIFNPAPYIGWSLIMGPLFLEGWNIAPINGMSLIISFYSAMIISTIGIIIIFAFARNLGSKISKILIGLSSVGLFAFGIYQLYKGIYSII